MYRVFCCSVIISRVYRASLPIEAPGLVLSLRSDNQLLPYILT